MKKILLFLAAMLTSFMYSDFQIRELNYQDSSEIEKVSNLFEDTDISKMTGGWTRETISNLLSDYTAKDQLEYGNFFCFS